MLSSVSVAEEAAPFLVVGNRAGARPDGRTVHRAHPSTSRDTRRTAPMSARTSRTPSSTAGSRPGSGARSSPISPRARPSPSASEISSSSEPCSPRWARPRGPPGRGRPRAARRKRSPAPYDGAGSSGGPPLPPRCCRSPSAAACRRRDRPRRRRAARRRRAVLLVRAPREMDAAERMPGREEGRGRTAAVPARPADLTRRPAKAAGRDRPPVPATAGPRPGASSVAPRGSRSGGAGIFGGPSPPHAHLPKRRARCWKERRARRKSISRNAGQFTSVK
jgi:hypothetical protein